MASQFRRSTDQQIQQRGGNPAAGWNSVPHANRDALACLLAEDEMVHLDYLIADQRARREVQNHV